MSSRIRFELKFTFVAIVVLAVAALVLAQAPAATVRNDAPAATSTGTETVLYSFGVGPTGSKCTKTDDGADPKGSLTYVPAKGLLFGRTSTTTRRAMATASIFQIGLDGSATQSITCSPAPKPTATIRSITR